MEIILYLSNDSKYIQQIKLIYPNEIFTFEEKIELKLSKTIKIGDEEYLKRISYRTEKNDFITWMEFTIKNEDNNLRVEAFGVDFN